MSRYRIARFLDYESGSLLLLTEDFVQSDGRIVKAGPDFSWWISGNRDVVGYSIDGLDRPGALDRRFPDSPSFRVSVPQLRLANASVYEVAAAARTVFVEDKEASFVGDAYNRALRCQEQGALTEVLYEWCCLYHVYGHIDGLYWMGCSFIRLQMPAEAVRWLARYTRHCPGDAWGQRQLGYAFFMSGDRHSARRHLELSLEISATSAVETDAGELLAAMD